jgi:hypothetical protein
MQLTNEWISGFVDGEGCFNIQKINRKKKDTKKNSLCKYELFIKEKNIKTPSVIEERVLRHRFIVKGDKRSIGVLYGLKRKFKCGTVHKGGGNMMAFQVSRTVDLENIIVPFFQKYPLLTKKGESFCSFVKSLKNYNEKNRIIENEKEKNISTIDHKGDKKQLSQPGYNFSDNWFRGFIDAEGCFFVSLVKDYPRPQLIIVLESKEKQMLVQLQKFLKCGTLRKRKDGYEILQIVSSKDYERYIFPKLQTKSGAVLLQTVKRISYQKFRKIVRLICEKKHQTIEGLEKIKKLKKSLNKENDYLSLIKTEKEYSIN